MNVGTHKYRDQLVNDNGWIDGWINGWLGRWIHGWIGGWMTGLTNRWRKRGKMVVRDGPIDPHMLELSFILGISLNVPNITHNLTKL